MKKSLLLVLCVVLIAASSGGQVAVSIDNSGPDTSAMLDVKSTAGGFLPPRMTYIQRDAISAPVAGLVIWCTNCGISGEIQAFNGTSWTDVEGRPSGCGTYTVNHVADTVAAVDKTTMYHTVTKIPGEPSKCWITSNLGSDRPATAVNDAAEAAAGWYWQFNRKQGYKHDGVLRWPNTAWIGLINEDSDWQPGNDPCSLELGTQWRIPAQSEWWNVWVTGGWTSCNGSWNSGLNLHGAGMLFSENGGLYQRGSEGNYWTSKQYYGPGIIAWWLHCSSGSCYMYNESKALGCSVRCLREN